MIGSRTKTARVAAKDAALPAGSPRRSTAPRECGNCRFYVQSKPAAGYCHRHPPKPLPGGGSPFPLVSEKSWCGEHQHDAA